MTSITINGQSYTLCTLPAHPGQAQIEIAMNDSVAVVTSPFTRQEQTQPWPGGDFWDATVTLPPMTTQQAACWRGFLAELRGRANVFQLSDASAWPVSDPMLGTPVVATSGLANLPMTTSLVTRGWTANKPHALKAGQQFQVGYRLYMACEDVPTDSSGNATIPVWPSIRETPADGTGITLVKPTGLFRLSMNRRGIQWSPRQLVGLSFKCVEAR